MKRYLTNHSEVLKPINLELKSRPKDDKAYVFQAGSSDEETRTYRSEESLKRFVSSRLSFISKHYDEIQIRLKASEIDYADYKRVLVFEFLDNNLKNLKNAFDKIENFQFLAELIPEDKLYDDCLSLSNKGDKNHKQKFYAVLTTKKACDTLLKEFSDFHEGNLSKTKIQSGLMNAFKYLEDIRFWNERDRVTEDIDLLSNLEIALDPMNQNKYINLMLELWFLDNEKQAKLAKESLASQLNQDFYPDEKLEESEFILDEFYSKEISQHQLLVKLPIDKVSELLLPDIKKLYNSQVADNLELNIQSLYWEEIKLISSCLQAQAVISKPDYSDENIEEKVEFLKFDETSLSLDSEVNIAVLDGMPYENHATLKGRILVQDAFNVEAKYTVMDRQHGTAVNSIILNGDNFLDQEQFINQRILNVPIYQPVQDFKNRYAGEFLIQDRLPCSVIRQAIEFLTNPVNIKALNQKYTADINIKIINLSFGILRTEYYHTTSPLAKLLDYYAHKHNLLFMISAGNKIVETVSAKGNKVSELSDSDKYKQVLKNKAEKYQDNRIISPAESLNNLTIGSSSYGEFSPNQLADAYQSLYNNPEKLATYSRVGSGYKLAPKPELLLPGGVEYAQNNDDSLRLYQNKYKKQGLKIAIPKLNNPSAIAFEYGTSYSCALATNQAFKALMILKSLRVDPEFAAVNIKNSLVNSAMLSDMIKSTLQIDLLNDHNSWRKERNLNRFIGFGACDKEYLLAAKANNVLFLVNGYIYPGEQKCINVPIPEEMIFNNTEGRRNCEMRLTSTLSWFSAINAYNYKDYLVHKLGLDLPYYNKKKLGEIYKSLEDNPEKKPTKKDIFMKRKLENPNIQSLGFTKKYSSRLYKGTIVKSSIIKPIEITMGLKKQACTRLTVCAKEISNKNQVAEVHAKYRIPFSLLVNLEADDPDVNIY